jgi:phosphatidylethanolamine-binding protein (PEBP) family uncharacterized protein
MRRAATCLFAVLVLLSLTACKTTHFGYVPQENLAPLAVSFADAKWTGAAVPADEVCDKFGGAKAASPRLNVSGIPAGADALIIEFNDRSYAPLSSGGGHGAVLYRLPSAGAAAVVPSVPAQTTSLPEGFTMLRRSGGDWPGLRNGAYLPPCSGGTGNRYEAVIYAVDSASRQVLAKGVISLGRY